MKERTTIIPLQRVTGEKTDKGLATGIFGNGELDWHSNMNGDMDRARGVALQGAWHSENIIQHLWIL